MNFISNPCAKPDIRRSARKTSVPGRNLNVIDPFRSAEPRKLLLR